MAAVARSSLRFALLALTLAGCGESTAPPEQTVEIETPSTPVPDWLVGAGGAFSEGGVRIAADGEGNAFVHGWTEGSSSIGATVLPSHARLFVTRYGRDGNAVWSRYVSTFPGQWVLPGMGDIALDGGGNVLLAGPFVETAALGSTVLESEGSWGMFVANYTAAGDLLWARGVSGNEWPDGFRTVAVDNSGNVYAAATFRGTIQLDGHTLTSEQTDFALVRYAPHGSVVWARQANAPHGAFAAAVATDAAGNPILAGNFTGTLQLGTTQLEGASSNGFVAKFTSAGEVQWALGVRSFAPVQIGGLGVDAAGNSYVAVSYLSAITMGSFVANNSGQQDAAVIKISPTGVVLWGRIASGSFVVIDDLAVDAAGNCAVTGWFTQTARFGRRTLAASGFDRSGFLVRYSPAGEELWAAPLTGSDEVLGTGVAIGGGGVYVTGSFNGTLTAGTRSVTSAGGVDMFLARYPW